MLVRYWKECELYLESADMVSKIGQCGFKETFIWYGNVGKVCFVAGKVLLCMAFITVSVVFV